MLAGSHRNAWPDETGTGGRTNRNTQKPVTTVKTLASTDINSAEDEVTDRYRFGARG